jgi:hypothetical protein
MPIDTVAAWLIPGIGLASGLIATYVSLQNRALLAEVRKELAELESRIILRLNGLYLRKAEADQREALLEERLEALAGQKREAASDLGWR